MERFGIASLKALGSIKNLYLCESGTCLLLVLAQSSEMAKQVLQTTHSSYGVPYSISLAAYFQTTCLEFTSPK